MRNEYQKLLIFANRMINTIIIDQHYKISHPEITDELILSLIDVISDDYLGVINAFRVKGESNEK
jgi:hypothetical protein